MDANPYIRRALVKRGFEKEGRRRGSKVGSTRWGQAWLGALHNVDDANRLGRGLTLANQGGVTSLEFVEPGLVEAHVAGSSAREYRVELRLEAIDTQQVELIKTAFARRPSWLDAVLSSRLPSGLTPVLEGFGVRLFPRDWRDLGMSCSCPDRTIPCKHIAAVLYRLAQYIDNDPMLLFQVRGFDLTESLRELQAMDDLAIAQLNDLREARGHQNLLDGLGSSIDEAYSYSPALAKTGSNKQIDARPSAFAKTNHDQEAMFELLGRARAAQNADLLKQWPKLLPQNVPWFEGGKLADLYVEYLTAASAFWRTYAQDENATEIPAFNLPKLHAWQVTGYCIVLERDGSFAEAKLFNSHGEVLHTFKKIMAFLAYAQGCSDVLPALYAVYKVALSLVLRGAVVAELIQLDRYDYRVRWLPAINDEETAGMLAELESLGLAQGNLCYRIRESVQESEEEEQARLAAELDDLFEGEALQEPEELFLYHVPKNSDAVNSLLSTFLRPILLAGVDRVLTNRKSASAKAAEPAVQLLFLGRPVNVAASGDVNVALALQLWLRRTKHHAKSHSLLVQLDEVEDEPGIFHLSISVLLGTDLQPIPLAEIDQLDAGTRLAVIRSVTLLTEAYQSLGDLLPGHAGVREFVALRGSKVATFLFDVLPALRLAGAQILLPRGLDQVARPRLSAVVSAKEAAAGSDSDQGDATVRKKGLLGLKALVRFNWEIAVADQRISAQEFAEIADGFEGIVRLRDGFVWLEEAQTQRLLQRLSSPPKPAPQVLTRALISGDFQGKPVSFDPVATQLRGELLGRPEKVEPSLERLQATLRPYQVVGLQWLLRNSEAGIGSLLADDMGLGKTLQTIALLEHYRSLGQLEAQPALIILPTSLITNWSRELDKFTPELRWTIYHGSNRNLAKCLGAGKALSHVVLTSYGTARSDAAKLQLIDWGILIIDEAQQIKNPEAAQTTAVKSIEASIKIALSGTPVENRLSEYWSVLDFANPGYLGPIEQFTEIYSTPIERDRDPLRLQEFRRLAAPVLMRRLKTDRSVIKDLPDKLTQIEYCALTPAQAGLYQQVIDRQLLELSNAEPEEKAGRMLKFMTAVKQVCNHPHHYLKQGAKDAAHSGKALRMIELTDAALAAKECILIFTQYREMGELISRMLTEQYGYEVPFLHGGLDRTSRDEMVAGLQQGSGPPILILSIKAGGTGLNLTAANHVIHYDLWWNPAVESQATDRAFRIGQKRNVHVHRLICAGTFEERIDEMLSQKMELADMVLE